MNIKEAKALLQRLTENCLNITGHCKKRMLERGVMVDDILFVIMWGNITNLEKDTQYDNWKCTITGKDIEGDELTVITAINKKNESISCITVC